MLGKSLSNMSLEQLQHAVMGNNPSIEPYQALAAIEKMVKGQKAKAAQMAQQPRPQGMVAQRTLAEAAALRNPYMAAGLGAAPVPSPVTSPMGEEAPVGMAGGGMVAFQAGGSPKAKTSDAAPSVYMPAAFDNTIQGMEVGDLYAQAMAKLQAGQPLTPKEQAVLNQGAAGTQFAPPSRLPGTNIDTPAAFNNKIENFQAGDRYAQEMAKIKADGEAKLNAPMSGQAKALTFLSAPAAVVGDVLASPVNLLRNAVRNPLDRSERPSMTPFSDARTMALADDFGGKALREMRDAAPTTSGSKGFEEQVAQGIADLESKTGRKLSEGAKEAFRKQEMAKMLKNGNVQSTAAMDTPASAKNDKAGLASAAAARGVAGTGGAGAGAGAGGAGVGRVGLGGTSYFDENKLKPMSEEDRIAAVQKYKKAMGAQNEEFLRPIKERLEQYETEAKDQKKYALGDALLQAGLGMMAGKSQYAFQNIGEGGAAGLAAYRESKKADRAAQEKLLAAQGDMAKSRIALEKGDEQTAVALANQGRQEQQAAAQYDMLGKYYAGSNAAQMAQANAAIARANALGGTNDDKHMLALTKVRTAINGDADYKELAKMAALPGPFGDNARTRMAAIEKKYYQQLAPELLTKTGGNTMGAGGVQLADADTALINKYLNPR